MGAAQETELQRQAELEPGPLHDQNRYEWSILIRDMERATEPGTAERRRDCGTGLPRGVALFAQMCQYDRQKPRMVELNQQLGRRAVRQVPA